MLSRERHGDLEFATVHVDHLEEAIESMKARLPDEERVCSECLYEAETRRFGIKTFGTVDPERRALVLCCPSCESHVDLPTALE